MSIKKVENGWYYDLRVHGKRYRGTERTKRKAEDKVIELQQMRYSPRERKTNTVLITNCLDLFEKRISELVKVNARSPKYLSRIQLSGKHFRKYFKELDIVYVKQINYLLIDNYISFRRDCGKAEQTITNEFRTLHAALRWAVSRELILSNPLEGYKLEPVKHNLPEVPLPSVIQAIFNELPDEETRQAFYFILATGCRFAEFAALRAEDIAENIIKFHRNTKRRQIRYCPLPALPFRLRKRGVLFTRDGGYPWKEQTLLDRIQRACKSANANKINIHTLRHCHATYELALGGKPYEIMSSCGWKSFGVFERYVEAARRYNIDNYLPIFNKKSKKTGQKADDYADSNIISITQVRQMQQLR